MNPSYCNSVLSTLLAILAFPAATPIRAQLITIETVLVGDANNAAYAPSSGDAIGSVSYRYEIGRYEVTLSQYAAFLNAVAKFSTQPYLVGLWNQDLQVNNNTAGISRSGDGSGQDPFVYTVIGDGNKPISDVTWFDAARFANWVNNGATATASTETGSYNLNGATAGFISPNASAVWRLPSADEWFKAAYYKGGGTNAGYWRYATRSDVSPGNIIGGGANQANYRVRDRYAVTQSTLLDFSQNYLTPVGVFAANPSAYNTFDQTGNVTEWTDGLFVVAPPGVPAETNRAAFGGSWMENFDDSSFEATSVDRNARFGALPQTPVFGFRLVKLGSPMPSPSPTPFVKLPQVIPPFVATNNVPFGTTLTFTNTTTDAGLPVGFQRVSGPVAVSSNTARITGVGPVVLRAQAAGNANYNAATPLTNRFTSVKADQSIPPFAPTNNVPFGTVLTMTNTKSSVGRVVRFAVVSGPAKLNKNRTSVTITGVGSVVLRASQPGTAVYNAATPLTNTFTSIKADQTISFSPKASVNFKRNATVALGARSSSRLPVSYTSSDTNVLTISRGAGVMKSRGTVQVTATQAGNANYNAAPEVVRTIEIK